MKDQLTEFVGYDTFGIISILQLGFWLVTLVGKIVQK